MIEQIELKRIYRIIIYILTFFSFIAVVALGSRYDLFPGALSVKINNIRTVSSSTEAGVMIDQSSRRVIILDSDGNCRSVIKARISSDVSTYFSAATVGDDGIYVAEFDFKEGSSYYPSERIIKYDFSGNKIGSILEIEHTYDDRVLAPTIQSIVVNDGRGMAACVNTHQGKVCIMTFSTESLSDEKTILPISFSYDNPISAWFAASDPSVLIIRNQQNIVCSINLQTGEEISKEISDTKTNDYILADINEDGDFIFQSQESFSGKRIPYYSYRMTIQIIFWISCIWITIILLLMCIRSIRQNLSEGNYSAINITFASVILLCICVFIVVFYSYQALEIKKKNIYEELSGYAAIQYSANTEIIDDCISEYMEKGEIDSHVVRSVEGYFENSVYALSKLGQEVNFSLIYCNELGERYLLCDSKSSSLTGWKVYQNDLSEELLQKQRNGIRTFSYEIGEFIISSFPISDSQGNNVGSVIAYRDMDSYYSTLLMDCVSRTILLLSIMISLGFLVVEGRAAFLSYKLRRKMQLEGCVHTEITMARTFVFLLIMTASVNSTLLAVIVKEMVANTAYANNSILLALPLTVYSFGYVLGSPVRKHFIGKIPQKRLLLISAVISAAGYFVCYISVSSSNIILFTVAILISNIFLTVIFSYAQELVFYSQDIGEINRSISAARISGSSIAGVVAGQIANKFGNEAIQLTGMVFCLIVVLFIVTILPSNLDEKGDLENQSLNAKAMGRSFRALFSDPIILTVVVCMLIPIDLFGGYKAYLFPCIASEGGIDKGTISNMIVFCNAIVFFVSPLLNRNKEKTNQVKTLLLSCGGISCVFMMFIIGNSVLWAVATLAFAVVTIKIAEPIITTIWQKRVLEIQSDKQNAQIIINGIANLSSSLRSPILGCLLQVMGFVGTCFCCGALGTVGTVVFSRVFKKHKAFKAK